MWWSQTTQVKKSNKCAKQSDLFLIQGSGLGIEEYWKNLHSVTHSSYGNRKHLTHSVRLSHKTMDKGKHINFWFEDVNLIYFVFWFTAFTLTYGFERY